MLKAFRLRRLALPLLLALAGWSGYWLYAQFRAQQEFDREVARLQARGGDFTCSDRQWQGFPLRLVMTCTSARLEMPGGPAIETAGIEAVSHLYAPRQAVARVDRIVAQGAPGWSVEGHDIDLEATAATRDRLEFSASGDSLTIADGRMPAVALDGLEIEGAIDGLPRTRPRDWMALLQDAARRGSKLTIDRFEARMADVVVKASGSVELGPEGPAGTLSTTVSNYEDLLADLQSRGVISNKAAQASAMVIGFLQSGKQKDGEVTVALRFHEGRVFWGPFAVAEIPPLR